MPADGGRDPVRPRPRAGRPSKAAWGPNAGRPVSAWGRVPWEKTTRGERRGVNGGDGRKRREREEPGPPLRPSRPPSQRVTLSGAGRFACARSSRVAPCRACCPSGDPRLCRSRLPWTRPLEVHRLKGFACLRRPPGCTSNDRTAGGPAASASRGAGGRHARPACAQVL